MQECTLNFTDSSMTPLKRIVVELLDSNKHLETVMKTDDEGNVFFDGDVIDYYSILSKYANNKEYREIKEAHINAIHTHRPLTKLDENRYIVLPIHNKKRILNIVCTWFDKAGNKVGQATSNETSDCNMFIPISKAQPTYFTLTTKKGEKKKFKDFDSRVNLAKDFVLEPNIVYDINMIPL